MCISALASANANYYHYFAIRAARVDMKPSPAEERATPISGLAAAPRSCWKLVILKKLIIAIRLRSVGAQLNLMFFALRGECNKNTISK